MLKALTRTLSRLSFPECFALIHFASFPIPIFNIRNREGFPFYCSARHHSFFLYSCVVPKAVQSRGQLNNFKSSLQRLSFDNLSGKSSGTSSSLTAKFFQTPVDVNRQTYEVSYPKKNLILNAIRKGIKESVIENMLDDAAIVPSSSSDRVSRPPFSILRRHTVGCIDSGHHHRLLLFVISIAFVILRALFVLRFGPKKDSLMKAKWPGCTRSAGDPQSISELNLLSVR